MTLLQLNTEFVGAQWKRVFAEELIRRIPDINPDSADEVADAQYPLYPNRSPACTAAEYAQALQQAPDKSAGGAGDRDRKVR
jgi:hypothetical protein